jgi:hypothetical protein
LSPKIVGARGLKKRRDMLLAPILRITEGC